jgi:hypothetical protein
MPADPKPPTPQAGTDIDAKIDAAIERINRDLVAADLGELLDPWPVSVARELRAAFDYTPPAAQPAADAERQCHFCGMQRDVLRWGDREACI